MTNQEFIQLMSTIGVQYEHNNESATQEKKRIKRKKLYRPLFSCKLRGFEYFEGKKIKECLEPGSQLFLKKEKAFDQDKCTVAVYFYQFKLGYLPNGYSCAIARMLENGYRLSGIIQKIDTTKPITRLHLEIVERL